MNPALIDTDVAQLHHDRGEWQLALAAAEAALKITERPKHYLTEPYAWGDLPQQIADSCAHNLREVYTRI